MPVDDGVLGEENGGIVKCECRECGGAREGSLNARVQWGESECKKLNVKGKVFMDGVQAFAVTVCGEPKYIIQCSVCMCASVGLAVTRAKTFIFMYPPGFQLFDFLRCDATFNYFRVLLEHAEHSAQWEACREPACWLG